MSRSIRRRALVRATLPVIVAACALPSAASAAATVELSADGTLTHRGASGEINSLNVRMFDSERRGQGFRRPDVAHQPVCVGDQRPRSAARSAS